MPSSLVRKFTFITSAKKGHLHIVRIFPVFTNKCNLTAVKQACGLWKYQIQLPYTG
jgi:hypothetical protein